MPSAAAGALDACFAMDAHACLFYTYGLSCSCNAASASIAPASCGRGSLRESPPSCHLCRCIGKRFAIEEAVFTLVRFFQAYTIALDKQKHPPDSTLWARTGITFQPAGGIYVKLTPRDAGTAARRPEE